MVLTISDWWVGGVAAEKMMAKDATSAANALGEEFYRVILQEEPFASTKVINKFESRNGRDSDASWIKFKDHMYMNSNYCVVCLAGR